MIQIQNSTIDMNQTKVIRNNKDVFLTALEYKILLIFALNPNTVFTREQILASIWDVEEEYVNDNTLTVYIKRIRQKIEEAPSSVLYLHTSNYKNIDKMADDYTKADKLKGLDYYNIKENMRLANNIFLAVKILVYGFITLFTLIGVPSVFNTINTSIALRRKEFAVLRSVGLTSKGFKKH